MRRTLKVTFKDRDEDKMFLITELSAAEAEDWALQAFFALANAGVDLPDDAGSLGMGAIAEIGLKALGSVPYERAKPLLDKMMTCVHIIPDAGNPNIVRPLIDSDIEDVATRLKLRKEVFKLHMDFLDAAE